VRAALKWLGIALVVAAVATIPFTIWISERWGVITATAGLIGCVLVALFVGRPPPADDE
jgi:hypothetical protein